MVIVPLSMVRALCLYGEGPLPIHVKLYTLNSGVFPTPGGILRIAGIAMTPRIILMTDGNPTDSAGQDEVDI